MGCLLGGDCSRRTVVDIGNTHTVFAIWQQDKWIDRYMVDTAGLKLEMFDFSSPVAIASVVPKWREILQQQPNVVIPTPGNCCGKVDFSLVDASTLGADRLANAVALAEFCKLPALVVDCGTAVTVEIVDENRCFRGGAIAPGRKLMRNALHCGTAQLPELSLTGDLRDFPGVDTGSSLAFGIDCGAIGMVKELIEQCKKCYNITTSCYVTGGDAQFFAQHIPGLSEIREDFTLQGIRLAAFGC